MNGLRRRRWMAFALLACLGLPLSRNVDATPNLMSVTALKNHGAAGSFYLALSNMPVTTTIEPRTGPTQTLIFNFDGTVTAGSAAVLEGTATLGTPTYSANQIIVPLSAVANGQYVSVGVGNVSTTTGGSGGGGVVRLGYLAGDVNQSGVVTTGDVALVNAQLSQPVTGSTYLFDVNASGAITVADKAIVNSELTTALPGYGFWDQGFNSPKVRSNYPTSTKGNSGDPLVIVSPCLFGTCPFVSNDIYPKQPLSSRPREFRGRAVLDADHQQRHPRD